WIGSHRQMNRIIPWRRNFCGLLCLASRQRQNSLSLRTVIERMKPSDFIETTNGIKGVEKTCVAGRKLARLEVTATQVCVAKCLGALPGEKVKTQPAAVGRRDALRFPEKGDEQQQNQVSVHLRLKLKVARKIFRRDLALSAFELERGVQRMIEFFNKRDQRSDIPIPQPRTRIRLFELTKQPAGIINADRELVSGTPQKRACH